MRAPSPESAFRRGDRPPRGCYSPRAAGRAAGPGAELVLAADQFLITPVGRVEDAARAHAAGDEIRTVIAGYHWFTDWGRDTMISLEGLTLATGRKIEAGWILRTFAHYIRDGLIPNLFPEGQKEGLYHTADATLWFFHAIHRYLELTGDRTTLSAAAETGGHHRSPLHGTRFGIGMDPDGRAAASKAQEGYQLTWMDAKVGDWVVTPRRGKAVEINALWYNALRLLEAWLRGGRDQAKRGPTSAAASRRAPANPSTGASGSKTAAISTTWWTPKAAATTIRCRPNQVMAISLDHPVLDRIALAAGDGCCDENAC